MAELTIPVLADGDRASGRPFRIEFRALILGSMLRSAELQLDEARSGNRRLRARLAEYRVGRLRAVCDSVPVDAIVPVGGLNQSLRVFVWIAWLACGLVMFVDLIAFGIHSPATTVSVVATQIMTIIWFFASLGSAGQPERAISAEPLAEPAEAIAGEREVIAEAFSFADDHISVHLEGTSAVKLKAVTEEGDAVDLNRSDAAQLADVLKRLSRRLDG